MAGRLSPPEWVKYPDPATELDVVRLTDPKFASGLTASHLRQFGRRSDFLLYWTERSGSRQICHLDLKGGESRQITEVRALDTATVSLAPDERSAVFFNGPALSEVNASSLAVHELHRVPESATRVGFSQAMDGTIFFAERAEAGKSRIVRLTQKKALRVLDVDGDVELVMARPHHPQVLYRTAAGLWLSNVDGASPPKQLKLEPGHTGEALWSPLGQTLLYLHIPDDAKELITLREHTPEDGADRLIARTSQFGSFGPNGDTSVFAGASRSLASAYVVILLRAARRELTLCEHRASDPAMVSPVFSPDSQSIFFVSDRHGKQAIYRVHVDKFVEATGDGQ